MKNFIKIQETYYRPVKKIENFCENGYDIFDLYKNPSLTKREIYQERNKKITITGLTGNKNCFSIYGKIKDNDGTIRKVKITAQHNYILID